MSNDEKLKLIVDMHTCQCCDCIEAQEKERLTARAEVIEEIERFIYEDTNGDSKKRIYAFEIYKFLTKLSEGSK